MKKIILPLFIFTLVACSNQPEIEKTQVPLDLKTVEIYQANIYSGNTVAPNARQTTPSNVELPLNSSDNTSKENRQTNQPRIVVAPSIGYGYYRAYPTYW